MTENAFELTDVRGHLDQALQAEIIGFWTAQGALGPDEAGRRVGQVHLLARQPDTGGIAGLCTIRPQAVPQLGVRLFYFRCFTAPDQRSAGLAKQLLSASYTCLNREFDAGGNHPIGMLLDIENPLLHQRKAAVWHLGGDFFFAGIGPKGHHIRIAYFDGARLG